MPESQAETAVSVLRADIEDRIFITSSILSVPAMTSYPACGESETEQPYLWLFRTLALLMELTGQFQKSPVTDIFVALA